MSLEDGKVSVLELRRLLYELKDLRPDICIRLRFIGELWQQHYCTIALIGEKHLMLEEEHSHLPVYVPELTAIVQFELSNSFKHYQPHFHYTVAAFFVTLDNQDPIISEKI
jgi:hypothetical protein